MLHIAVSGQESPVNVDCTTPYPSDIPKSESIVSMGVINSRAIDLKVPEYPKAALAIKVQGDVVVRILVDPRGCVTETDVISGHQLLAGSSLAAAAESVFQPVIVGGNPVFVHGIIVYKYLTTNMNWLELGFYSNDIDKMLEFLPVEIAQRYALYEQKLAGIEEGKLLTQIRSAVIEHGAADAKSIWLFRVGEHLREIERPTGDRSSMKYVHERNRELLRTAPEGINSQLLKALRSLFEPRSFDELREVVREIKIKMYFLGN